MPFIVVIPARLGSARLPGKPLLDIGGLPMVIRTAQQAARSRARRVVIATDDEAIMALARKHGVQAMLTRADHPTGTDRLAEVAEQLNLDPHDRVVNVQGDEPLVDPQNIDAVASLLAAKPDAAIATCAGPITDAQELFDPNVVKVVCSHDQRALYFSRAPIPWARDALMQQERTLASGLPARRHIGLYAYRAGFLRAFPDLRPGPLEAFEALEQLRALENGFTIVVGDVAAGPMPGVDTIDDLQRVRQIVQERQS